MVGVVVPGRITVKRVLLNVFSLRLLRLFLHELLGFCLLVEVKSCLLKFDIILRLLFWVTVSHVGIAKILAS